MLPRQAKARLIQSVVGGNCVRLTNRRQSDSEDRSKSNRLAPKNSRHPIRQAPQLFKLQSCNAGVKGQSPLRSLGGSRGPFSHVREWPPYCALPHAAGEPKTQPLRAAPPSAPAGCPKPRSRAYVASAEPRSALKSGRNALHSHPSSQRRRTPSPSFTSKVKTTASSVCALTR